ncbi:cytosolic phospholipase A2 zeta-like isoform X2 [Sardina pilchardus]|uniref:cytosolic phospholipase A2 zeta-like isoform X2 n=1 Tax=Sardina pilchardus TaxID=27697 RepID=UPI002E12E426
MDVVIRHDLCDDERDYVQKRLQIVCDCLLSHGIDCKPDEVPRVALLGSGGGERAFISILSVLRQLGEDNLLDCFLYLAGVSGSTWAMSSLYAEPHWSENAVDTTSKVLRSLSKGEGVTFSDGVQWLMGRHKEGDLSLSDAWGVITCGIKGVSLETRTFSDEASRDQDGADPYPLYSAMERTYFDEKEMEELWFEFSPHEAGFTEHGAFVKTSLLKQEFEGGRVKYSPNRKPMDMVQLQGITGCVFGDVKEIEQHILDWIKSHLPWSQDQAAPLTGVLQIVMALVELVEYKHDMDYCHTALVRLKSNLGAVCGKLSPTLHDLDYETWTGMEDRKRKQHVKNVFGELIASADEWGQEWKDLNNKLTDALWVIKHILPLVYEWEVGNVPSFLYHFNDPRVPEEMCKRHTLHLIDAGLFLNSPYPSVLREAREVDIIVSFDFTEKEPFKTLEGAKDYADANHIPFPKIDVNEHERVCPKSFYVFEEEGKPTVIHIPLFNVKNCKDEATIKQEWDEYDTFRWTYRDKEKIGHLVDLAAANVNRDDILKEIRKAAERRKAKH